MPSAVEQVHSKIRTVEAAMRDAGTDHALQAIVETLKSIAAALTYIERHSGSPNFPCN